MPANTIYLFHCEGADGSQPSTEDGPNKATLIWEGTAALTTSEAKFGNSSLKIGGSTAARVEWLTDDLVIGTGNLTVEFWINIPKQSPQWTSPMNWWGGSILQMLTFGYDYTAWGWTVEAFCSSNTVQYLYADTGVISQWYHLAYVRQGMWHQIFMDGVLMDTKTCTKTTFGDTNTCYLTWGGRAGSGWDEPQEAYIDEIRVSDIARWTATFTPATAPYTLPSAGGALSDSGLGLTMKLEL